jgi:hypothetical protein
MAHELQHQSHRAQMAARMNMLKLLQEVRGFAQFAHQASPPRPAGPLLLEFRGTSRRRAVVRRKLNIRISMQEPPDIPQPVPIVYLDKTNGLS